MGPYINFQGRAREAMEFYHRVLGGTLDLWALGENGELRAAGPDDNIASARLEADGVLIVAVDGHPKFPPTVGDNMAIALGGNDYERLSEIFSALAEGGKMKAPLRAPTSGASVGYLVDQFGINWVVTAAPA